MRTAPIWQHTIRGLIVLACAARIPAPVIVPIVAGDGQMYVAKVDRR